MNRGMMAGWHVDWSHFSLADFLELRWRLLHDWQAVLPGGEYFGQARIGDVCYDIQIEWLKADTAGLESSENSNGMELFVTMSPFFPHDKDSVEPPYDELVPGMPYDTQHGASLIDDRRHFLQLTYETFLLLAERGMNDMIARFTRLQSAAARQTGFWDRHDAILCKIREQDDEDM